MDDRALAAPGTVAAPAGASLDLILPGENGRPATVTVKAPKGTRTVSESPRGAHDIPATAVAAYQRAAAVLAEVDPACRLPWTLLAAIGRVESDHGRYAGAALGTDGVSEPLIIGVPLNGVGPVAAIRDTDEGTFDRDTVWDRAVGPMQFIPSTWAVAGVDGDGDGKRSPNDIDDAALAAAVYLCAGTANLQAPDRMSEAIHRYNNSDSYTALVMAYEQSYRTGDFTVPTVTTVPGSAGFSLHSTPITTTAKDAAKATSALKKSHNGSGKPVDMTGSPVDPHVPGTPTAATGSKGPRIPTGTKPRPWSTPRPSTGPSAGPSTDPSPRPPTGPSPGPSTGPAPLPAPDPTPAPAPAPAPDPTARSARAGPDTGPARPGPDTGPARPGPDTGPARPGPDPPGPARPGPARP